MSKQQAPVTIRTEFRPGPLARLGEPATHRPVSFPGKHLRTAVDSVLAELSCGAEPDVQAMHRFDDTLRWGLAWTAAVGDTCQVAEAVHAVRDARSRLDAEDADRARAALLAARDGLQLPSPRSSR